MIVALDFETSGLDPKRHFPVSIGIALMENDVVLDTLDLVIAPPLNKDGKSKREYDLNALEVSGISWPAIKRGYAAKEVMMGIKDFTDKHKAKCLTVVAFNAPFDLAFWSELCFEAGEWSQPDRCFKAFTPPLIGPWQCSRMMAMDRIKLPKYSLDTVSKSLGFSRSSELHGALEDAILAGRIYGQLSSNVVGL